MKTALIVATIHRTVELSALLKSLCEQNRTDFYTILIDQNPAGFLSEIVEQYSGKLDLEYLNIPPVGVSAARNAGLAALRPDTEIIAFPDDDCTYEPDVLNQVQNCFRLHPGWDGVLGQWQPEDHEFSTYETAPINRLSAFKRGETYTYFLRWSDAIADLRFDSQLGPGTGLPFGGGEDTDYLLNFLNRGNRIFRFSGIHLRHPEPDMTHLDREKLLQYANGRMYLLKKHHFPLWFKSATVFYPLFRFPFEPTGHRRRYRFYMFLARLKASKFLF